MTNDRRLIEDYLPIQAISAEASREKSVRKGHISTLHLWWARRPLVACRAAVYGALVPADRFRPANGPEEKRDSLARANAARFVERLCKYPGDEKVIADARRHILEAHADRLTEELAEASRSGRWPSWVEEFKWPKERHEVTYDDIVEGRAPRPRVLDPFAGGGAIPLEALRLGCEAYALDLNPVAHIIELCTLVYPQKYGQPDPTARGMTGPKNERGETTWGGLAEEVRYWGNWVLERVRREIGDLYPPIPDPDYKGKRPAIEFDRTTGRWVAKGKGTQSADRRLFDTDEPGAELPPGYLTPVAYLWTRTVRCKNPACGATVPLVRQTWLCKKKDRYVALEVIAPKGAKKVRFQVVEAITQAGLGFDPTAFSKAGNATCPFCGTVADNDYVKSEGCAKRIGQQGMAIIGKRRGEQGKVYLSADDYRDFDPQESPIRARIQELCQASGLAEPIEKIEINPRSMDVDRYGYTRWSDLFTARQMLCMLTFCAAVRAVQVEVERRDPSDRDRGKAIATCLACAVDKQADFNCSLCVLKVDGGRGIVHAFGRQALPMVWDFAEANPFNPDIACWAGSLNEVVINLASLQTDAHGMVTRGSAINMRWSDNTFDAIVTDPPYYDNVSYSTLSDFFYVWLKRAIGTAYPEHFASHATPKKNEIIAAFYRYGGSKQRARAAYENMMARAFMGANRVLKAGGQMAVVYAHKTTLGWSTLVDALRQAGFAVTEAWPLDTETSGRLIAHHTAALASSILLVGRKRTRGSEVGSYEDEVQPELQRIVRERVETLWQMGIPAADLKIAAVGAGLRPFTRFQRVEYANGEDVPPETFLTEVEAVVLDTLMSKIFGVKQGGVAAVDAASRFYVLWRYVYKAAEVPAGEAIVFQYGQDVELEELASGKDALLEQKKGKYRLRDYTERGSNEDLGYPWEDGTPAPLVDVLHRTLWLMENSTPQAVREFLDDASPNREQLRVVAAALAGPGLSGKSDEERQRLLATTPDEQSALGKLLANWKSLVPESLFDSGKR